MTSPAQQDLMVLVPGLDEQEALDGLLSARHRSLKTRRIMYEIMRHPRKDAGCFHEAPEILRTLQRRAQYALVMFDHEGSGQEARSPGDVAADLKRRLATSGWGDRVEVVVLCPELEAWVWSDSPHVDEVLGWSGRVPSLREWLQARAFWPPSTPKPNRPKEAMLAALQEARRQRSPSVYRQLAESVGLDRCQDPAFQQICAVLRRWFPEGQPS